MHGLQEMAKALKSRSMQKYYRCLVAGQITEDAHLKGYLVKDHKTNKVSIQSKETKDASYIETAYHPVQTYGNTTLLEVHLITGRSHQIRAHLASIGHPILGDGKYGDPAKNRSCGKPVAFVLSFYMHTTWNFREEPSLPHRNRELFRKQSSGRCIPLLRKTTEKRGKKQMYLYLMRHGETFWNKKGTDSGFFRY